MFRNFYTTMFQITLLRVIKQCCNYLQLNEMLLRMKKKRKVLGEIIDLT